MLLTILRGLEVETGALRWSDIMLPLEFNYFFYNFTGLNLNFTRLIHTLRLNRDFCPCWLEEKLINVPAC